MFFVRATGLGREERAVWMGRFFFSFFFSFRVNNERETTTGTTALMHFESRCGERDRVSSAPSEGWMRRVYARRKCSIRCVYVYISRISRSIDRVGLEEKRRRSPAVGYAPGRPNFGSLLRHFGLLFFTKAACFVSRLLTKLFVNATGWSRCRR